MSRSKTVRLLHGKQHMALRVPESAVVLEGKHVEAIASPQEAVKQALADPIAAPPLAELIAARKPRAVAVTISDITRPVPNKAFLPPLLELLNTAGVADREIVIVIGTGMHRPSTPEERDILVGREILRRVQVIDHDAHDPATLVKVCEAPPVWLCRRFAEADFRIVTGYIEPHFMAGFSGGRKGVCPALVDLATVQRFHGYETLADPRADNGILDGNPCHEIALTVARAVGVDFLFNVAITGERSPAAKECRRSFDRQIAGIYCGELEAAHLAGCKDVAEWTTAEIDGPFDLVITNGGGFPLDQTFYQTVKGMCTALPALDENSTLLQVSDCAEQLGSQAYAELMLKWDNDWRGFLSHIAAHKHETRLDQWEFQMQARVLDRIGVEKLWLISDGIPPEMQKHIAVTPILGDGDAQARAQRAIDQYLADRPAARVAVIPDGPYTMLLAK